MAVVVIRVEVVVRGVTVELRLSAFLSSTTVDSVVYRFLRLISPPSTLGTTRSPNMYNNITILIQLLRTAILNSPYKQLGLVG